MVELVDAADSKSAGFTPLRVQVSLPVPENIRRLQNVAAFLLSAAHCLFQVLLEFLPMPYLTMLHKSFFAGASPGERTWTTPNPLDGSEARRSWAVRGQGARAMRMIGEDAIPQNIAAWAEMARTTIKIKKSARLHALRTLKYGSKGGI